MYELDENKGTDTGGGRKSLPVRERFQRAFPRVTTAYQYLRHRSHRPGFHGNLLEADLPLYREVSLNGYAVIENYYSPEECSSLIEKLKVAFEKNHEMVHVRSDRRLFGIEHLVPEVQSYFCNPQFERLASAINASPSRTAFTLAGFLDAEVGKPKASSGEGWHRDAFFSQFKSMVYLVDVGPENGPFELIPGSHRLPQILKDMKAADLECMQYRISDQQAEKIARESREGKSKIFPAKAGTCIIFDSSAVHRGRPIESGHRVSLTNYFYENDRIDEALYSHFAPVVRAPRPLQ